MPNLQRICNGTTTLQLSNDNFVYCGAIKHVQHFSPSGLEVEGLDDVADDDHLNTCLQRGISHVVSWIYFVMSFEKIFDEFETPLTVLFVPINMFHNFDDHTSKQKMVIIAEKWILSFATLMSLGLFT